MESFPNVDYTGVPEADISDLESTAGTKAPAIPFTLGVVFEDVSSGVVSAGKEIISVPGKIVDSVKSTVRNTYLYLVGGIVLIGIVAIVVLGVGSRFVKQIEG